METNLPTPTGSQWGLAHRRRRGRRPPGRVRPARRGCRGTAPGRGATLAVGLSLEISWTYHGSIYQIYQLLGDTWQYSQYNHETWWFHGECWMTRVCKQNQLGFESASVHIRVDQIQWSANRSGAGHPAIAGLNSQLFLHQAIAIDWNPSWDGNVAINFCLAKWGTVFLF